MTAHRRRQYALYTVAFILAACAWNTVLHNPVYRPYLNRQFPFTSPPMATSLPDAGIYEAKDPSIGAPFPNTGVGHEIWKKVPHNKRGYLVAALGDCATCTALNLPKLYSQTKERGITLLAFGYGELERLSAYAASLRREGIDIPLFHNRDTKLTEALNSYYPGRLYYYTGDWKLRWRERDMHIDNYLFITGRFDRLMENTKP